MNKPIRILQVVTYMGRGGLETMLMNYYRHIDRDLVQFDFLTHRDFRADYDDEIESLGGKIYRLPRLVPWSPSYHKALDNFFAEHAEYRIVHVHQDCLSSVILKAAEKHGVPVRIAHSHTISQNKNFKYIVKLYYRRQIPRYATQLFACGEAAGEWMFQGAAFEILNNAIDARQYQFDPMRSRQKRLELGIPEDGFVVGHVGRFSPEKNHKFLLDVFAEVHRQQKNAFLLLVGGGSLRPEAEKKVQSLGLNRNVIFTGVRNDVPDLMQAMDLFVFPSLYEGLPVTMIEAQAAGLPCILSEGVPPEACITDNAQRISLEKSPHLWAERILAQPRNRADTYQDIVDAGFDIVENAKWLQDFYLEQWRANE